MGNIQRPIAFSLFVQLSISPSVQMGSKINLKSDRARVKPLERSKPREPQQHLF
jgi:hypothetical protein